MFSVLSAYLFGEEEEDNLATNEAISESEDVVEDWIFVDNAASNGLFLLFNFLKFSSPP